MATETLRPDADGNYGEWGVSGDGAGTHNTTVDEETPDAYTTCIYAIIDQRRDSFTFPNTGASGTIHSLTFYILARFSSAQAGTEHGALFYRESATNYDGSLKTVTHTDWTLYSDEHTVNPATSNPWTVAEINAMEWGILRGPDAVGNLYITQVYVVVDYTPLDPPTVTTKAATNVQATTARINGQISDDGGEACEYRFRYKKSGGSYSYTTWTGSKTTGQTFYKNISGLDKKSLYYFNAQARNSAGTGAYGSQLSFTTLATAPVVTTQVVDDIGTVTATGNGNITDIGGENCGKRGVCWNTTGNPTVADSKSEETDSFGTGAFTRSMTGLSGGQHYYVKAYAYNSADYGYGGQVEFTTVFTQAVGGGSTGIAGALGRNIFVSVGAGSVAIAGSLTAAKIFFQNVGAGAVAIVGTLNRNIFIGVGSGSIAIAGTLGRKIKLAVGSGSIAIAGTLTLGVKYFLNVGQGAVAITSTLGRNIKLAVGQGSVAIASKLGWTWLRKKLRLAPYAYSPKKEGEGEQ